MPCVQLSGKGEHLAHPTLRATLPKVASMLRYFDRLSSDAKAARYGVRIHRGQCLFLVVCHNLQSQLTTIEM